MASPNAFLASATIDDAPSWPWIVVALEEVIFFCVTSHVRVSTSVATLDVLFLQ